MEINEHLRTAIRMHHGIGKDFHDVLSWHLLHGVVLLNPDFMCLGYYCRKDDLSTPVAEQQADTGFVTFMTGSMKALKDFAKPGMRHIAFMRGFKNSKAPKVYDIDRFKTLIN